MFLPPKQIIYAVGKNIEIAEYYVLVAFDIPEKKSEKKIETNEMIQSLTTASSVAYFANVEEAREFATKKIVSNCVVGVDVEAPAVFKVQVEGSRNNNQFAITNIFSAQIIGYEKRMINVEMKILNNKSDSSSSTFFRATAELVCDKANFHGDFEVLQGVGQYFTFLCCLKEPLTLENNPEKKIDLPKGVKKIICDFVAGKTL